MLGPLKPKHCRSLGPRGARVGRGQCLLHTPTTGPQECSGLFRGDSSSSRDGGSGQGGGPCCGHLPRWSQSLWRCSLSRALLLPPSSLVFAAVAWGLGTCSGGDRPGQSWGRKPAPMRGRSGVGLCPPAARSGRPPSVNRDRQGGPAGATRGAGDARRGRGALRVFCHFTQVNSSGCGAEKEHIFLRVWLMSGDPV